MSNGATAGAAGGAAAAAAAARARLIAGAVRVKVGPEVFDRLLARSAGPVIKVSGILSPTWWLVADGFVFRCRTREPAVPSGLEVIDAESAE